MTQQRKKCGKGGFTLVELVVTLVILSILFAIAVPSLLGYIHLSQFRKNESYAKTMYLSAESELTYLRTGGEWESFCSKVKKEGVLNQSFDESDEDRKKLVGRIYGIRLDAGEYAEGELSGDGALVGALLSQDTYDKSVLNAAICIEIDVESGQVYSVFYGTNCKGLYYGSNEDSKPADMSGSWLDIDYSKRDRDTRREERLGYYSVQDAVNAVSLDATKLKITSINLVNGETLSLNWSSNVKDQDLDKVYYEVKLYSSEDKAQLLSINIPGRNLKTGSQSVAVTTEDNATKDYTFPVEYDRTNKRATLVLDGMMNAKLYDQLDKLSADNKEAAFRQSSDTSITRFGGKLENPLNVYAAVQVFPDPNAENTGGEEYQKSDAIESNKANTLFGDGTRSNNSRYEIETFRHLSNIRYMNTAAAFAVTARSLDWTSDSVKVYGTAARGALSVSAGKDIGFPSIPALRSNQTLDGTGGLLNRIAGVFTGGNVISNLKLDETSIADDAEYLGLFRKNAGTIHNLRLLNPQVEIASDKLKGVGAVCGYSNGSLKGDNVDGTQARVEAALTSAQAQGIGGVIGVNGENHVIEYCASKGTMNGLNAMGGVVGLNEGIIRDCTLSGSMGSATQDYIGGIAGLNVGSRTAGTIENCTTEKNCTVTGRNTVGGIVGYNLSGGRIQNNTSSANVNGAGRVGGIAGENGGVIVLSSTPTEKRRVNGSGSGVGGVIGVNTATGTLSPARGSAQGDIIAADNRLTVRGSSMVGGIAGINRGTLGGTSINCLTNQAAEVRAAAGSAGGVVGAQEGAKAVLRYAKNLGQVTANVGAAGGIVGMNSAGSTVENCIDNGSVTSNDGYAGGVASENYGTIRSCSVGTDNRVTLITRNKTAAGAICAVNHKGGTVQGATLGDHITISGSAFILGAVVGDNSGTVTETEVSQQPTYSVSASTLQVGGAVGINRAGGTVSKVKVTSNFEKFTKYTYLGGVVGQNNASGKVTECTYSGTIDEGKSAVGNCYGGIAGLNGGLLQGSTVSRLTLTADGVYTATSTSSAAEKERLSSHIGGIAGKNDTTGIIEQCYIDNTGTGTITVKNGMVGGVTGYNKGTITMSGDKSTETLMENVSKVSDLLANAKAQNLSADTTWVEWQNGAQVEDMKFHGSKALKDGRTMQIIVSSNGNLGGVAGYNAPTGELNRCVSGSWLLVNKSDGIGVGTGGIVGMNESEKDLSYLLNQAFVGRQRSSNATNRFAGGIIGTQSNKTTTDWMIRNCVNYGTVYGYHSNYSGGIVGQWTNNGGIIEGCYNYGNLQTTFKADWVGASGGIVAQLYHAASNQDFDIISCQNHGSVYSRDGESKANGANDSAGILGNITAYEATKAGDGQKYTINVVDCVNAPGVKIYAGSMASGIVGFFSTDNVLSKSYNDARYSIGISTENIVLNIDRCRNYAEKLVGDPYSAGIMGDRYERNGKSGSSKIAAGNTYIQNCFSVSQDTNNDWSIAAFGNDFGLISDKNNVGNNYYFYDTWGLTNNVGHTFQYGYRSESRKAYSRMIAFGNLSIEGKWKDKTFAAIAGPNLDSVDTDDNQLYYNMTNDNTTIDDNGIIRTSGEITGRVLFVMPDSPTYRTISQTTGNNQSWLRPNIYRVNGLFNQNGKLLDEYVRTNYRDMEHSKTASGALDDSFDVSLRQNDDGAFNVSITDDDRPLYYEGRVFVDGEEVLSNLRFIPNRKGQGQWDTKLNGTQAYGSGTTSGSFQLPASLAADTAGKTITLSVRAVSLFEDTAPSAWKTAATQDVSVLPTPDVNIRLVSHWNNGAKYQISLKNLADYAVFSNWKVTFRLGSQTVTIDQNNHTAEINGDDLKELIVTAAAGITNGIQPASVTDTIPTDTPKYKPDGSINNLSVSYSGSTVDDCTVTAALTVNEPQMETPPIYRIEVLGTVGTNEYVFAYEDVLTSAGNTVTANFRDLPKEYFAENVTNRQVRAWYAASGLGPVYTYGDTRQADDASVTLRTYSAEGVQQQDKTIYSHVLGHANDFKNYIKAAALNIKPLTAPELNDPVLKQEDNGSISYRFWWTQPGQGTAVPHYSVKLTGITAAGARIGIPVNEVYGTQENPNTSQSFTISADDWQYAEVELTVTRLGQAYGEVGLSTTKKYAVKQRLERPGQPLVINPDTNELEYTIGWSAIGSENGCAGYQIYVQPEGETAAALGELVLVRGGTCSVSRSLEDYAGKTIDLYLVAVAADDSGYADSPNGIVYTMTVPMRLDTPSVKWSYNWNATANNPIPAADFRSGGLQVTVTPENAASVPPGGSTYLLRAKITGTDGTTVTYPVSAMSESGGSYVCSLTDLDTKYAGCSVRFEARISQSAGQVSSAWVSSGDVVFPRVKLEAPSASLANVNETLAVSYGPMNRLINTAEWDAQLTALSWDEVAEADLYRIELTDKDDKSTTVTVDMSGNLPEIIINGQNTFAVAGDDWCTVKQGSAVNGRYSLTNGSIRYYSYQPDTMLQVKDGTFTLKLPNIFSVVTHENQTLQLTNGIQISRVTVIADSKSDRYTESDPAERRF